MASTKRLGALATHRHNRRDSGIYSESWQLEASEPLEHHDRCVEVDSANDNEIMLERKENEDNTITTEISGEDASSTETLNEASKLANLPDIIDEQECLLSSSENDNVLDKIPFTNGLFVGKGQQNDCFLENSANREHSSNKLSKSLTNQSLDTHKTSYGLKNERPSREAPNNHIDVHVINRCDALINQLQDVTQKYFKLEKCYQKVLKVCYLMVVVNGILLFCVITLVPLLFVLSRGSNTGSRDGNGGKGNALSTESQYKICFDCSDLKQGTSFCLETLSGVTQRDGKCCFRSITSVIRSQSRNMLYTLEDMTENVKKQLSQLNTRILQLEIGSAPNTRELIGNILKVMAPIEKTAVYLKSLNDTPFKETHDAFNKFIKLRWSMVDAATIFRGNVQLYEDEMNIRVTSEAYYFFYTKIKFRQKQRTAYKRETPLRYLVHRKAGSTSSYIHEAKLSCVFNDISQEHTSTTEMILHLNRDDEIFISIDDADKQFLSTETGSHSIGLFEI